MLIDSAVMMLRAGGWLLIAGGLVALGGAFTPPYKQWYAPLPEAMRTIAAHPVAWRVINGAFLIGTVIAALGFAVVAFALRGQPGGTLPMIGAIAFSVGTLFWILTLVFRLSVHAWAAAEFAATGVVPSVFPPLQAQASLFFSLFALFSFGGVATFGWTVLAGGIEPRWLGWTMLVVGIVGAPIVVMIGPWVLYVPIVLFGMKLAFT